MRQVSGRNCAGVLGLASCGRVMEAPARIAISSPTVLVLLPTGLVCLSGRRGAPCLHRQAL